MEPQFQTSFIPKQSVPQPKSPLAQKSVSLLLLGSIIVFLISAALAAGVFLYTRYLNGEIASQSQSLARAQAAFEPTLIQTIQRLSLRIDSAEAILKSHQAPSVIFDELSAMTLQTVSFKTFDYSLDEKGLPKLVLKGVARDYASVALQSDVLAKSTLIQSPIFSDLNPDPSGNISFTLTASINPASLIYTPVSSSSSSSNSQQASNGTTSNNPAVPPATTTQQ